MNFFKALFIILIPYCGYAQTDDSLRCQYLLKSSFQKESITVKDYYLPIACFPFKRNSSSKTSFKNEATDIINKALTLRTDSFTFEKNGKLIFTAVVHLSPKKVLKVKDIQLNKEHIYDLDLEGEIPANRAIEIVLNKYDKKNTKTDNGYLFFNDKRYKIIENHIIEKRLFDLIFDKAK